MKTQIRNNPGRSSYFGGGYESYGRYQWNIKYYGFEDQNEIEAAQFWAFGEYSYKTGTFDGIDELIGRPVKASIQGRSGGWFVIDTELTEKELKTIDRHVSACMKALPEFLSEERQYHADEAAAIERETRAREKKLKSDKRIKQAMKLIKEVSGRDAVLVIQGIKLI